MKQLEIVQCPTCQGSCRLTNTGFHNFNPNLHAIVSDGYFLSDKYFKMAPGFILKTLEEAFQYEV